MYIKLAQILEKEHPGKYALIFPASQFGDNIHRIVISEIKLPVELIKSIQREYPKAVPCLRYIGNTYDDPGIERIVTVF